MLSSQAALRMLTWIFRGIFEILDHREGFANDRSSFYSGWSQTKLFVQANPLGTKSAHRLLVAQVIWQYFTRTGIALEIPTLAKYRSRALQQFLERAEQASCDRRDRYFARSSYLECQGSCSLSLPWLILLWVSVFDLILASVPYYFDQAEGLCRYQHVTQIHPRIH